MMLLVSAQALRSDTVTFTAIGPASEGSGQISAMASLSDLDGLLHITLANTTPGGTQRPGDILTAFFFTIDGADPGLALQSAQAPSVVRNGQAAGTGVSLMVDGGYQLIGRAGGSLGAGDRVFIPHEYGLSTAGFGLFHGRSVGNRDYGIVADGTDTGNKNLKQTELVQTSATFVLSGFDGLSAGQVTSVAFAFGTGPEVLLNGEPPDGPLPPPVPEPATWALAGIGVAMVAAGRMMRSRA